LQTRKFHLHSRMRWWEAYQQVYNQRHTAAGAMRLSAAGLVIPPTMKSASNLDVEHDNRFFEMYMGVHMDMRVPNTTVDPNDLIQHWFTMRRVPLDDELSGGLVQQQNNQGDNLTEGDVDAADREAEATNDLDETQRLMAAEKAITDEEDRITAQKIAEIAEIKDKLAVEKAKAETFTELYSSHRKSENQRVVKELEEMEKAAEKELQDMQQASKQEHQRQIAFTKKNDENLAERKAERNRKRVADGMLPIDKRFQVHQIK